MALLPTFYFSPLLSFFTYRKIIRPFYLFILFLQRLLRKFSTGQDGFFTPSVSHLKPLGLPSESLQRAREGSRSSIATLSAAPRQLWPPSNVDVSLAFEERERSAGAPNLRGVTALRRMSGIAFTTSGCLLQCFISI